MQKPCICKQAYLSHSCGEAVIYVTYKMVYVRFSLRKTSRKRRKPKMELCDKDETTELDAVGPMFQKLVAFEAQRILSME